MTYSLGEVEALCRKAARGAGFSWGMAEEAGKTARWLSGWGLPGAMAMAQYLDDRPDAGPPDDPSLPDWSGPGQLCPLICGALISDLNAAKGPLRLHNLAWPILAFPHGLDHIGLAWEGTSLTSARGVSFEGDPLTPLAETAMITAARDPMGAARSRTTRVALDKGTLATLTRLAARTYAPETDASRLAGAGAGLKDED